MSTEESEARLRGLLQMTAQAAGAMAVFEPVEPGGLRTFLTVPDSAALVQAACTQWTGAGLTVGRTADGAEGAGEGVKLRVTAMPGGRMVVLSGELTP